MVGSLEKPSDIMIRFASPSQREDAFRNMAQEYHAREPVWLKKQLRNSSRIEYQQKENRIYWGNYVIPDSFGWKSTEDFARNHLGQIVLVLMVKNEAEILPRLLTSLVNEIDGFVILDTGSTDRTKEILWETLAVQKRKRGHIFVAPWYDFGANRTILMHLSYQAGDWLFLCDADYTLVCTALAWKAHLPKLLTKAPLQLLLCTTGDNQYYRPHLVQGRILWAYACRTHEYLTESPLNDAQALSMSWNRQNFSYLKIDHVGDGRSKQDKFPRDVILLLMDILDNPEQNRAYYYLGNTLSNMDNLQEWMLRAYEQHQYCRGWFEEKNSAYLKILEAHFHLRHKPVAMLESVMDAIFNTPDRLEPLTLFLNHRHHLPREWRHLLLSLSSLMLYNQYPTHHSLFIDKPIHEWVFWQRIFELWLESHPAHQKLYLAVGLVGYQKMRQNVRDLIQQKKRKKKDPDDHDDQTDEDWTQCPDPMKVKALISYKKQITVILSGMCTQSRLNNLELMKVLYDYGSLLELDQQYDSAEECFIAALSPLVPVALLDSLPSHIFSSPNRSRSSSNNGIGLAGHVLMSNLETIKTKEETRRRDHHLRLVMEIMTQDPLTLWQGGRRYHGVPPFLEMLSGSFLINIHQYNERTITTIQNQSELLDIRTRLCCRLTELGIKKTQHRSRQLSGGASNDDVVTRESNSEMAAFAYLLDALKIHPKHPLLVSQIRKYQSGLPSSQRNVLDHWLRMTHFTNGSGREITILGFSQPLPPLAGQDKEIKSKPSLSPSCDDGRSGGGGGDGISKSTQCVYAVTLPCTLTVPSQVSSPLYELDTSSSGQYLLFYPQRFQKRVSQILSTTHYFPEF
jgi:glycosyltransferase involved in cell wall biosynthesis